MISGEDVVVVWCLALWLVCLCLVLYGPRVECAFTSPVRHECDMFVMCCMQCCMSVSTVL